MREIKFRVWDKERRMLINFSLSDYCDRDLQWLRKNLAGASIMQYTGLKDKNGKEIYEGDVLKGGAMIARNLFHNNLGVVDLPLQEQWVGITTDLEQEEVIGNIYENPELLEDKNEKD